MSNRFVVLLAGVLLLAAALSAFAAEDEPPIRLVTLKGAEAVIDVSRGFLPVSYEAASDQPAVVPLRNGHLLAVSFAKASDEQSKVMAYLPYRDADGTEATLSHKGPVTFIGETPVSLTLKGPGDVPDVKPDRLKTLRLITVQPHLGTRPMAFLKALALENPDIGVLFEEPSPEDSENPDRTAEILGLFRPRTLLIELGTLRGFADPPAGLKHVEHLIISRDPRDTSATPTLAEKVLTPLPNLEHLQLSGKIDLPEGSPDFLARLRTLVVQGEGLKAAHAEPLADLRALHGLKFSGKAPLDLAKLGRLKEVTFPSPGADLSAIKAGHLEYASIAPGDKAALAAFVKTHPTLQVLVLGGGEGKEPLEDVSFLMGHKSLRALVLLQPPAEAAYASLEKLMPELDLLVLPDAVFEERAPLVARLRKANPEAAVARGGKFCLGSGWILLLVPVAACAGWIGSRRRDRGRAA